MDTKSLSCHHVYWVQKLSQYHFRIDYCPEKANTTADTLFCFLQRSQAKEKTLKDKNSQILHCLQISLIRAMIAELNLSSLALVTDLLPLHQVLICRTHVLPRLCQFWIQLQSKLAHKEPYQASIGSLKMWLLELQAEDYEA